MTVLALVSEKGGAGKTLVATQLASEWHRQGLRVLLADCDPQGSAATWADQAEAQGHDAPACVALGESLHKQVRDLASSYDIVILDTPGHRSSRMATALAVADLALVPVMPGAADVWSVERTVDAVATSNETREAHGVPVCPALLLANGTSRNTLTTMAKGALDKLGVPILDQELGRRVAFGRSFAEGQGVTLWEPAGVATLELRALADHLAELLELENGKATSVEA